MYVREENSRFIAKTCNLHLAQALPTHSLSRFELARMPSQGGGSSLRSISPTPRIHPLKSKWMKPHDAMWPPTPHTMTKGTRTKTKNIEKMCEG